jgi:predicted Zn-ribbon and HTH transcriptional regulator
LAEWQTTQCDECGVTFERHKRTLTKCPTCRIPIKLCKNCGKAFRPADLKKVCCSTECSRLIQVASFRAQHTYTKSLPKLAECIVCHQIKPVRRSGSGVAKTCSPECSKEYRANLNKQRQIK